MISSVPNPGLYFSIVPRPTVVSPLRTDVAGFIGRTRRGPIGKAIRVEEWRGYLREFGGLLKSSNTTYAVRGYFENGGEVAYVVRACGADALAAKAAWIVSDPDPAKWAGNAPSGFVVAEYRIVATSPGEWANGTRVRIRYRRSGGAGKREVDIFVQPPDEPPESLIGLSPEDLAAEVARRSGYIRLEPTIFPGSSAAASPRYHVEWDEIVLRDGTEGTMSKQLYLDAADKLNGEYVAPKPEQVNDDEENGTLENLSEASVETSMIAVPGVFDDLEQTEAEEFLGTLVEQADRIHDRLVLIDLPNDPASEQDALKQVQAAAGWLERLRAGEPKFFRAAAAYHPRLRILDPLGGIASPVRSVPPSGHVAGLISRLDRERGAHHTPANAQLFDAVDITRSYKPLEQAALYTNGINLIRCFAGRGIVVWGGRTSDALEDPTFIAHRRLIHRLIRAIRRVADPLVFDVNGPELRLTIVRAVTSVLLEAWRAGALKGATANEAFRVKCDDETTPPEESDLGRVFCEIEVAPAVPMEFILLRVALSTDAALEVFET